MKKLVVIVIVAMLILVGCSIKCTGADSCECETCWAELERVEHMYE